MGTMLEGWVGGVEYIAGRYVAISGCGVYSLISLKLDMSMPRPAVETGMLCDVVRACDSRAVGKDCCAMGMLSSFHQPAVLVVEKSGEQELELEKAKSMFDESVGPQVVMGILRELGGVKAERVALDAAEE